MAGRTRSSDDVRTSVTLSVSGHVATVEEDEFVPGAYRLVVDGTPQSHVDLEDPRRLFFEYVQRMGHVIDLIDDSGEPLTALHLGAGALTLPRYVEAMRPGSTQHVVELESDLVDLVRRTLPWPDRMRVRIRHGDAREVLGRLPRGMHGAVDLVVVDVFSGARTPAHVTSTEFYSLLTPLLSERGVVLVNAADGPGLAFARAQAATLRAVLPHVIALAETQVLKGRRFGNIVFAASTAPFDLSWMPRLMASGPHPAKVVAGDEFEAFAASARPVTDDDAVPSPLPGRSVFQVRP